MEILNDDRKGTMIGKCENCNRDGVAVRRVESMLSPLHYYSICFVCLKPTFSWRNKDGRVIESPAERKYLREEELEDSEEPAEISHGKDIRPLRWCKKHDAL